MSNYAFFKFLSMNLHISIDSNKKKEKTIIDVIFVIVFAIESNFYKNELL